MLTPEHILNSAYWAFDLYADCIAVHWRGKWRWAYIAPHVVGVAPNQWPNRHRFHLRGADELTTSGLGLERAIERGWVTISKPLDEERARSTDRVRFGRVGRVKGQVILDPPIDYSDGDDISPPWWSETWIKAINELS